ncbi:MAG: recombinase family protein [Pseudobdellovibrionaceae bacterium]
MKVAIYARVSTSHHEQNPDIQIQELRRYCEARGWHVAEEIIDFASGGTDKREGLHRLFHLVENKFVTCIAVTKLDRLFRSLKQLVGTLDEFHSKGVAFVATRDAIDYTTPSGRLFTQILGSLAEFERSLIRERTIAGLQYAKAVKGKTLGRPKQKRNVALIMHLKSQGLSTRKIAKLVGCSQATVVRELQIDSKRWSV